MLNYTIYGQGSALDVAHKVAIIIVLNVNVSCHTYMYVVVVYDARGVAKQLT